MNDDRRPTLPQLLVAIAVNAETASRELRAVMEVTPFGVDTTLEPVARSLEEICAAAIDAQTRGAELLRLVTAFILAVSEV